MTPEHIATALKCRMHWHMSSFETVTCNCHLQLALAGMICYGAIRMLLHWSRALVFVASVSLVANAHCVAKCASETRTSTKTSSNSCHHHKSPHEDNGGCSHQHADFTTPETGLVEVNCVLGVAITTAPALLASAVSLESHGLLLFDTDSPPGNRPSSTISVLLI